MSCGRRPKGRPRAFVFAWAETEAEAEQAITLHCRLSYGKPKGYVVTPTWSNQDIHSALTETRRRFRVVESEE